jgi:hypothetical protein
MSATQVNKTKVCESPSASVQEGATTSRKTAPLFQIVKLSDDKSPVVLEQCCIR